VDQHASGWICAVSHIRRRAGKSRLGYVRNGYTLEETKAKLPHDAQIEIVQWNEPVLRFFRVGL
jgi:hypothetical protein